MHAHCHVRGFAHFRWVQAAQQHVKHVPSAAINQEVVGNSLYGCCLYADAAGKAVSKAESAADKAPQSAEEAQEAAKQSASEAREWIKNWRQKQA